MACTPGPSGLMELHYKTNSLIISRIMAFPPRAGSSNYRAGSSNYQADCSNYQLSVGPGRLIIQLSAWYFQCDSCALRTFLARAAKSRTTGLRHARTSVRAALRLCAPVVSAVPPSTAPPGWTQHPSAARGAERSSSTSTSSMATSNAAAAAARRVCQAALAPALAASRTTPTPRLR